MNSLFIQSNKYIKAPHQNNIPSDHNLIIFGTNAFIAVLYSVDYTKHSGVGFNPPVLPHSV